MTLTGIGQHILTNAAAIFAVAALALRDQLKLRLVLMLSIGITLANTLVAADIQWDGAFWTVVTLLINIWVTVQIILDRTHIGLRDEEERLFTAFGSLSPGEFRRLLKQATWRTADGDLVLTQEGAVPDKLFYVLDGTIGIVKGARSGQLSPRTFIGEIAFLRGTPASATVSIAPQSRFLEWTASDLHAQLDRHANLKIAVTRLLSADMAIKVARAGTG